MAIVPYKFRGIDNKTPYYGTGLGFTTTQQNFRLLNGCPVLTYGKFKVTSSALNSGAVIAGATSWQGNSDGQPYLIVTAGAKIYTAPTSGDLSTWTFTERTGASTPQSNHFNTMDSLNGILVIAGGTTMLKMTSATSNSADLGGTPPVGRCVKTVNNYLFVGGQLGAAATYSTVSWSNPSDPETWPAANAVDFRKNDGDFVTALSSVGTDLIIFKNKSVGKLSTTGTSVVGTYTLGPLVTLSERIGCPSPLGVDVLPDGTIVFLASDFNLYQCDGNTIKKLSEVPSPGPNYQLLLKSANGAGIGLDQTFMWVKVDPSHNEIRLYGGSVYNYLDNYWYSDTFSETSPGGTAPFTLGYGRSASSPVHANSSAILFGQGTTTGNIFLFDNPSYPYPSDDGAGTAATSAISFTVPVRDLGFIPRFMKVYFGNVTLPTTTTVKFAWEGTGASSGTSVGITSGSATTRTFTFAIPTMKDAASNLPSFLNVLISGAFSSTTGGGGLAVWFMDKLES
jgi:hypothetical protein